MSAAEELPFPTASRLWWAAPAVGILLLAVFGLLFGGGPETVDWGTSYDASNAGFRAAYLILEELKYPVERSRRPAAGGEVRWVLFPTKAGQKEGRSLADWVDRGGVMLLAVGDEETAAHADFPVRVANGRPKPPADLPRGVSVPGMLAEGELASAEVPGGEARSLRAGATEVTGPPGGRVWATLDGRPLVTVYARGGGEVWLLNRPDVLANVNLRHDDNAVFAARLADAMLDASPGDRLAFDEYLHGLRDRPDVMDLLFRPPVLGVTLQAGVVLLLAVWHFGARFGPVRTAPPPPRRSKEEFLDAMAELLARKGDRAEAYRTVRDDFRRRLEYELGLPADTPAAEVAGEAARRRGVDPAALEELLTDDRPGRGAAGFVAALGRVRAAARVCLTVRRR